MPNHAAPDVTEDVPAEEYDFPFALGAVALAFVVLSLFIVAVWTVRGL